MNLKPEEIERIGNMMKQIAAIAEQATEPLDPKLEIVLELAHALLDEQLNLDKRYVWGEPPEQDDRFLGNSPDILSAEELRRMVEGDDDDNRST